MGTVEQVIEDGKTELDRLEKKYKDRECKRERGAVFERMLADLMGQRGAGRMMWPAGGTHILRRGARWLSATRSA